LEEISKKTAAFTRKDGRPLRVAKLQVDGITLQPHDIIDDVLRDGETVFAVDFYTWIDEQRGLEAETWLKLVQQDCGDETDRWTSIGRTTQGKVFVCFGEGYQKYEKIHGYEVLEFEAFQDFGKEGKILIGHKEGNTPDGKWALEAHYLVSSGSVKGIQLSVHTSSAICAEIREVPLIFENISVKHGEIKVIQSESNLPKKHYTIPENASNGSTLEHIIKVEHERKELTFKPGDNKSTGNLGVEFEQSSTLQADQDWSRDGAFNNMFYSNFKLTNTGEEIFVIKVKSEYEKDGEWIEAKTRHGSRSGLWYYNWRNDPGLKIPANNNFEFAVCTTISVKAPQYDKNRRAHHTLPQPLKIRITLEGKGVQSSIIVYQQNEALEPKTPETLATAKSIKEKNLFFSYADDVQGEERLFVAIYDHDKRDDYVSIYTNNNNHYIYKHQIEKIAYKAQKEKKNEYPVDSVNCKFDKTNATIETYLLVDLENRRGYALRFTITTGDASSTSYYLLPF